MEQQAASGPWERDDKLDVIKDLFAHHPPDFEQAQHYRRLRELGMILARAIEETVPPGVDRRAAISRVSEAVMIANRGIATRGITNRL